MCQLTTPLLIIYSAVTPCMLLIVIGIFSRPRALAARVYYLKLLHKSAEIATHHVPQFKVNRPTSPWQQFRLGC